MYVNTGHMQHLTKGLTQYLIWLCTAVSSTIAQCTVLHHCFHHTVLYVCQQLARHMHAGIRASLWVRVNITAGAGVKASASDSASASAKAWIGDNARVRFLLRTGCLVCL